MLRVRIWIKCVRHQPVSKVPQSAEQKKHTELAAITVLPRLPYRETQRLRWAALAYC